MDLRTELQQHLGTAYTLGRELGGGGMSRVFLAEEVRLGRSVVVKVLSPELAQGLNVDRFEREIRLAASLQQANIVPLLVAGDINGLPYFTMPYVEGESLRARLGRDPLSISEIITVLRDVTRALAYAHARGVVHRDIKPDNVLLSGGAAVVTDFGIAKAISASRTGSAEGATLTQLGTSLGTPAYMSPEQVAGDPNVDHRADLYSLGCVAFELLTGQQPFGNRTPQRMLAAHLTEEAPAVSGLRPDCPPQLAALVARLMAKNPDERPQSAAELIPVLDTGTTTSGASVAFSAPGMFKKALGWYALALIGVAVVAKAAVVGIGLPDWVFPGAILLMALGLPALLATAYVQRVARHTAIATPTLTPGGTRMARAPEGTMATMALKASPHLTWRRAAKSGYIAVGAFAVVVAAFMILRGLGIGPWGSLFAAGRLAVDDRILIGDFAVAQGDSALGPILVEAVRAALSQSRSVRLMEPASIADILQQMKHARDTRLDLTLAREVATRAGAQAVLGGRLARVGTGYAVSLDLTSAQSGATLASFQGTADGPNDLLDVVDDLTRKLRGRMGESLKQVQRTIPLQQATTSSLEALRKYSDAVRANDVDQDFDRAVRSAREAVALDSTFALAWRKLGVALFNARAPTAAVDSAVSNAARLADRLPDREKYLALGVYYEQSQSAADRGKALAAYQAAYAADSASDVASNQLALIYGTRHQYDSTVRYARREAQLRGSADDSMRLAWFLLLFGQTDSAAAVMRSTLSGSPKAATSLTGYRVRWLLNLTRGQYDSARAVAETMQRSGLAPVQLQALDGLRLGVETQGQLKRGEAAMNAASEIMSSRGGAPRLDGLAEAMNDILFRARAADGARGLDGVIAGSQWAKSSPSDRPYAEMAFLYAEAGRPDRARAVLQRLTAEDPARANQPDLQSSLKGVQGDIALAEGKHAEALQLYRAASTGPDGAPSDCSACIDYSLARTFDRAGQADSAVTYFQRYLRTPPAQRLGADWYALAAVQKRMGELYDSKGDTANAVKHYAAFTDLWKNADPDLQPVVSTVKKRMGELTSR